MRIKTTCVLPKIMVQPDFGIVHMRNINTANADTSNKYGSPGVFGN